MTPGETAAFPPVSIIVLNWNSRVFLNSCLSSLTAQKYPEFTITVVDNASTDDSVAFIRRHFPGVHLLANRQNLGFAAGMNVALGQLNSDVAVLFNPDAVVADDWLQHLVTPIMEDDRIGIAGCKIFYPDGKRLQHAGGYITHPRASPAHYGLDENDIGQYDSVRDVEYVTGAAMALRRTALEEVGLFDEGFFLYYEEVDLCLRVAGRGYRVVYVPDAVVLHEESGLAKKGSMAYLRQMHASRWRFLLKHYNLEQVLAETIPAERKWLAHAGLDHKRAADYAYRVTLRKLPEIWIRRAADSIVRPIVDTSELKEGVKIALRELRRDNWQSGFSKQSVLLSEVEAKQVVQARPFRSAMPVIGPLVARLREAWNDVSTKWYVRSVVQQQNEFNRLLVEQLREQREWQELKSARLLEQGDGLSELERQVSEMKEKVDSVTRKLQSLSAKLEKQEPRGETGSPDSAGEVNGV